MSEPIELITLAEAARRLGVCGMTLRRAVARREVRGDAFLVEGPNAIKSPLFVQPRLKELGRLVAVEPEVAL